MGKIGNYIVGASVVAAMSGNPVVAEAQENVTIDNSDNKVEYVQDNLRDELKNDSAIAWETVASVTQQLNDSSENSSREDTAQEMRDDANEMARYLVGNSAENEHNDKTEKARSAVFSCMAKQQTHSGRISQRYGATEEEFQKMQADGKNNVYGDFLEYLATSGDKKLGKILGVSEDQMTPEGITMALAYGPKIPYEVQEQIYKDAKEDGRFEEYKKNCSSVGGNVKRYPELSLNGVFSEGAARLYVGGEKSLEFADKIAERYGENANALLVKAFAGDKELAEKMGFKGEKPDAQQLVYMLAYAKPLSEEVQNKMITEQDRAIADNVLAYMANNNKTEFFTMNYKEQKSQNIVQNVIDMVSSERGNSNVKDLGIKLKEDLSHIHPKTENNKDNAKTNTAVNMAITQKMGYASSR